MNPGRLLRAIQDLHRLDVEHVESVQLREESRGEAIFDGDVELFRMRKYPQATHAYAWSYYDDDGRRNDVVVLVEGHIKSARDAVQAVIAMSKPTKEQRRGRQIHKAIRQILLNDWDPVGVKDVPEAHDEYDSYVVDVYRLLLSGATEEQIADHLWHIEAAEIGLSRVGDLEELLPAARKLRALDVGPLKEA
ncbi:MAG TPA: hypothetical protein VEB21_11700 [Terriglobales bacterium]|nr:hypothetical protein [Terriglobales bacterium]